MQSTPSVLSTAQEGIAIHQLWQASDRSSSNLHILLVTREFHMRRTQRLFERQGLTVASFPVDFQAHGHWAGSLWHGPSQWPPTAAALDCSFRGLRELLRRLVSSLTVSRLGDLCLADPGSVFLESKFIRSINHLVLKKPQKTGYEPGDFVCHADIEKSS